MNLQDEHDRMLLHDRISFFGSILKCARVYAGSFHTADLRVLEDLLYETAKLIHPEAYSPDDSTGSNANLLENFSSIMGDWKIRQPMVKSTSDLPEADRLGGNANHTITKHGTTGHKLAMPRAVTISGAHL